MKKSKYIKWLICFGAALLLCGFLFFYVMNEKAKDASISTVFAFADAEREETKIHEIMISERPSIVLPSSVSKDRVILYTYGAYPRFVRGSRSMTFFKNGKPLNVEAITKDGDYTLSFYMNFWDQEPVYEVSLYFSENLPAVYLRSEDVENYGRAWVEADPFKNNKAKGSLLMQEPSGAYTYSGELTQIKGRGNTTWGFDKRPYQIKTNEKVDLLGTGNEKNKSKTWVLLANYLDLVGMRNHLALSLGAALSMPTNIEGKSVDLYYDGVYRGMYMLTEKVEVAKGRVDVFDLDKENEKINTGIDFSALPVATSTTANGAVFTYCRGLESPENITGGYLLEMDYEVRALEEICYFKTKRGKYIVVKSPEYASLEEMRYIATMYQDYEDAVFSNGTNERTGKKYSDYIDARSVACYYLINEFSKSRDTFQSSAYLYKDADTNKFVMGPLWDYDMSFGKGTPDGWVGDDIPYGLATYQNDMCRALMSIQDFYALVKEIYEQEFVPILDDFVSQEDMLSEVATSGAINAHFWHQSTTWQEEANGLEDFITKRKEAMSTYFSLYPDIYRLPEDCFYDVFEGDPYDESIKIAVREAYLSSAGDGLFFPEKPVNRAQMVYALCEIADPKAAAFEALFSDVDSPMWFAEAAVWCCKNQWLVPYADGSFRPDASAKREEVADLLYRFVGMPMVQTDILANYKDRDLVTKADAIAWAIENEMLLPKDGKIDPEASVTMAEFAHMLVYFTK